ncbi:alpha/beta fold hydrolase [Ferrimicrobium sp.]|uniref:alpha/beta fold hydrolase n=1 Tax=Ferrimicrobium sp. TaxID=2926050 RepID=UPI00260AE433|nr:alpha/beta fold hydrolase [Ferrimicrobium sp.]
MSAQFTVWGSKEGATLVLLNSLGTTSKMWLPQIERLSGWFRIVAIEHDGHLGEDFAPTEEPSIDGFADRAIEILDSIGVQEFSVCGLSLGGMIAMSMAARHPERVSKLVLACTAPALPPRSAWEDRAATVLAQGTRVLVDDLVSRWFPAEYSAVNPQVVAGISQMVASVNPKGYAEACLAIASCDLGPLLPQITAETLVIAGAHDPVVSPKTALEFAMTIPDVSLAVLPHSAHLANLSESDRFTQLLKDHLLGTSYTRGLAQRRLHLGTEHVRRSMEQATTVDQDFIELLTETAWGSLWARPGLQARERSLVTIALLAGLNHHRELELHLKAGERNGLSKEELREVLLHVALYAGIPVANEAFRVLKSLEE